MSDFEERGTTDNSRSTSNQKQTESSLSNQGLKAEWNLPRRRPKPED